MAEEELNKKIEGKKEEKIVAETKKTEQEKEQEKPEKETEEKEKLKKPETKKPVKEKPKKTEAVAKGINLPISAKKSAGVCRFIKNKTIEKALDDLNDVLKHKKSVPIKGEIPHRKGPGKIASGSGGYPKKTVEHFIKLLKNLSANANVNGLENPVIVKAVANIAFRPYGRFGAVRKKRTHIEIKVMEKNLHKKWKKKT
jgi:ribosomal protein L22